MIKINKLTKTYGKKSVFSDVTVDLGCRTYGLLGPNGAGKTTFLRIITGLLRATKGSVVYEDVQGGRQSMDDCQIGYLPQKFGAFKEITVKEQMEYFAALKKIPAKQQKEEIGKALDAVNLEQEREKKCGKLSGGMVRRLGVAQAILGQPDLLLLDEPTAGLDPEERMRFKSIILKLKSQFPILLSTHIVEDVEAVCERILVLSRGGILFQGTPGELSQKAEGHLYGMKETDLSKVRRPHYVEKYVQEENEKRIQILTFGNVDVADLAYMEEQRPSIEDGYMYLLKSGDSNEV